MERLILASSSPRRKELLETLSIPFVPFSPDLDETIYDNLDPEFRVGALAEAKALAVGKSLLAGASPTVSYGGQSSFVGRASAEGQAVLSAGQPSFDGPPPPRLVVAADTLVVLGSGSRKKVIGKPATIEEARSMVKSLQGNTHRVYSGLCLLNLETGRRESAVACTKLRFAPMSDREVEAYLASEEWRGAAGAYRIQGQASYYIDVIEGSWSCVVGLPIRELYVILCRAGYDFTPDKGAWRRPYLPSAPGDSL